MMLAKAAFEVIANAMSLAPPRRQAAKMRLSGSQRQLANARKSEKRCKQTTAANLC
jgi:hypothetical protein